MGLWTSDCIGMLCMPLSCTRKIFERPKSMSLRHFSSAFDMNKKFSGLRSLCDIQVPMAYSAVVAVVYGFDDLCENLPSFYFIEIFAVDDAVEEFAAFADPG